MERIKTQKSGCTPAPSMASEVSGPIDSRALFGRAKHLIIEHDGVRYRLTRTRNGKLILTK